MNIIIQFLDWLAQVDLYPFYPAWNVIGVALFCLWIFVAFMCLRPRLGILKGGLFAFLFSFMWISFVDEINIFLSLNVLLDIGWKPIDLLSRWMWKSFLVYWCLKLAYKYNLPTREIRITRTTMYMLVIYWIYYFLYYCPMFYPYNFRTWFMTPFPRWFVFTTGHLFGWIFSTIIFISIWYFDMPTEEFLVKYGIGETYMLYALQRRFNDIKRRLGITKIAEYATLEASRHFPERDWDMITHTNEATPYHLVFVFRPYNDLINTLRESMEVGQKIMLSATNRTALVTWFHKTLKVQGEIYSTKDELEDYTRECGLKVIESGYYDSPFWVDHSPTVIVPTRKLGIDMKLVKQILFLERLNGSFFSHHPYVIGEVVK